MIQALVDWFDRGHRPLPWRERYAPYHVWVSEVMLQQTQVDTVLPYYHRFLERFPTLDELAEAEEEDVLRLWSGLGYYNRARNFRAAARLVVRRHDGRIPSSYDELLELPGIGRYMAGAILSIAFNKPYPIVDGNVRRVLSRFYGWKEEQPKAVWEAAEEIVRSGEPRIVNQALMELGATVCSAKAPQCLPCPWNSKCVALKLGIAESIPAPRKRPRTVHVQLAAVIDQNQHGFLMRETEGMWEFPTFTDLPTGSFEKVGHCRHSITHHRMEIDVYEGKLGRTKGYRRKAFDNLPITSLTRKIQDAGKDPQRKNEKTQRRKK